MASLRVHATLIAGLVAAAVAIPASSAAASSACTDVDVDVDVVLGTVVYQSRVSTAPLRITAKPGVSCTLHGHASGFQFLDAAGAPLATGESPLGQDGKSVTLRKGSPAHIDLTWMSYPDSPTPERPAALMVSLPGADGPRTLEWTGGDVYGGGVITHTAAQPGLGGAAALRG
jgi:hypothetical protein